MIYTIVRHCKSSILSDNKDRPANFSKYACHHNMRQTVDGNNVKFIYLLDGCKKEEHPILKDLPDNETVIEINVKSETKSFLELLKVVENLSTTLDPNDIIYAVEDDYMHRIGWNLILEEGINIPNIHYVSLYDHRDKYILPMYKNLRSSILYSKSIHWRTTPSTTNTYAAKVSTWIDDIDMHKAYSLPNEAYSRDHEKFLKLWDKGRVLITPIPAYSTHMEPVWMAPIVDWN